MSTAVNGFGKFCGSKAVSGRTSTRIGHVQNNEIVVIVEVVKSGGIPFPSFAIKENEIRQVFGTELDAVFAGHTTFPNGLDLILTVGARFFEK
jgi:hypothetical protein